MIRKFWANSRANTTILFALSAIPIALGVGAGVDMVRANRAQAILQAAADAAALSAGAAEYVEDGEGKNNLNKIVDDFIAANKASSALNYLEKIETKFDKANGSLSVEVRGKMNTSLMRIAGIDTMDISAIAQVELGSRALEVALVLDNTGSMFGTKIENLKAASLSLVGILHEAKADYATLKIGVVPYSEYVNVGVGTPAGGWRDNDVVPTGALWEGCVGSRPAPLDEEANVDAGGAKYPPVGGVNCVAPLQPLTTDRALVEAKINGMTAEGNTYIPGGLVWGWNVLTHEAPFSEAMSKNQLKDLKGSKALILMTDGENTITSAGALHDGADGDAADVLTAALCDKIKADEITLFTVAFQVPTPEIKNLLEQCASAPEMAFDAENSAALNAAFVEIGSRLASLYLTK